MAAVKGRWATILVNDAGAEEITNISLMDGGPPEINKTLVDEKGGRPVYIFEEVAEGVQIGMVRGGTGKAAGGFGFPEGYTATRSEPGISRPVTKGPDATALSAVSHEKQRGTEPVTAEEEPAEDAEPGAPSKRGRKKAA